MKKWKKCLLGLATILCLGSLTACGASGDGQTDALQGNTSQEETVPGEGQVGETQVGETQVGEAQTVEAQTGEAQSGEKQSAESQTDNVPEGNYIELALNVYFNDGDHGYYSNEAGPSIYVTEEGTYTVTFDCARDLSSDATGAGITELKNLTAIYILDMGVGRGEQSPLSGCDILYRSVVVEDQKLSVTQKQAKSAFKGNGVFDTNDPINAWDGSMVEEVSATAEHVANFTTVEHPTKIEVTFSLENMVWGEEQGENTTVMTPSGEENGAVFHTLDLASMDALTLTEYMGNGINLGNTMEAYGHATLGALASVKSYETYWGQPQTTAQMFVGMKNCGFDSVRIPVAWTNMMDYENGDYRIDEAYLDRVEELVSYALDAEMFVIINDHWDGGWWARFGSGKKETVEQAWTIYESIWTQVADRFKDYSEMLIFESANEELGDSLNDNSNWADSGKLSKDDCYRLTNEINQRFVDLVRSSGGKNDHRFLLIAGYNTDFDCTVDSRFQMPTDTAEAKLLLSVHYYSPWNYCGAEKQARWGRSSEYEDMNRQFAKLEKFTKAGYGVIIGEYGALPVYNSADKSITLKENTLAYTENLLDNCDLYNYCPMLWSCNDFFNRSLMCMASEDLQALFVERRYELEAQAGGVDTAGLKEKMKQAKDSAPKAWEDVKAVPSGAPVAWIMWNGGAGTYSVGDTYNPSDCTAGITATDVILSGAGEYTVSLEFAEGNDGLTFAALGIANGESLFKKPTVDIKEILVDGEPIELIGDPYTTSDDGICTRVNLLNPWVNSVPADARSSGASENLSAVILDKTQMVGIHSISVTFEVIMK